MTDMPTQDFKDYGKQLIDWIANYLDHPAAYPVLSQVKPGEIRSRLPAVPPAAPEDFSGILQDFNDIILPGITHWNNPAFFAYFGIT